MEKTRWSAMDQGWWTEWKEGIVWLEFRPPPPRPGGPNRWRRRAEVLRPQHARPRLAAVDEQEVRKPRQERLPDVRSDEDCRRLNATLEKPVYRGCFTLIYAYGFSKHYGHGTTPCSSTCRGTSSGPRSAMDAFSPWTKHT